MPNSSKGKELRLKNIGKPFLHTVCPNENGGPEGPPFQINLADRS